MDNSAIERPLAVSLTAAQLKMLAMAFMLIDHIGAFLLPQTGTLYPVCRTIGRLAFPIFCFLIAEGAQHTRSLPKYMARLAAFALLSTPPYNLVHGDKWYAFSKLNVFFTLLLGLMAIGCIQKLVPWILEKTGQKRLAQNTTACTLLGLPLCIVLYVAAYALHTDYGGYGVAAILIFYLLRQRPLAAWGIFALITFVGFDFLMVKYANGRITDYCAVNPYALITHRVWQGGYKLMFQNARQVAASLAVVPCGLYKGKKGSRSPWVKYAFYAFYPLHLTVIWLIQTALH